MSESAELEISRSESPILPSPQSDIYHSDSSVLPSPQSDIYFSESPHLESPRSESPVLQSKSPMLELCPKFEDDGGTSCKLLSPSDVDKIDELFLMCDEENTGLVRVSSIIDRLRHYCDACCVHDYDGLKLNLDPDDNDVEIDIFVYRKGFLEWYEDMPFSKSLSGSSCESDDEASLSSNAMTSLANAISSPCGNVIKRRPRVHHLSPIKCELKKSNESLLERSDIVNFTYGSLEASGAAGDRFIMETDSTELQNRLDFFETQHRKVCEENLKLRKQLESSEDNVSRLTADVEDFQKKLWSLNNLQDKLQSVRKENEELKSNITSLEENLQHVQNKLRESEKENLRLISKEQENIEKLRTMNEELESAFDQQKELQSSLVEYKERCEEAEVLKEEHDTKMAEKTMLYEDLEQVVHELSRQNEALNSEKNYLEEQLMEARQDMSSKSLSMEMIAPEMSDEDNEFDADQSLIPVKAVHLATGPAAVSTPVQSAIPSLLSEIKNVIFTDEATLPSPLCDKVSFAKLLDDSVVFDDPPDDLLKALIADESSKLSTKLASQFNERKSSILDELNKLIDGFPQVDSDKTFEIFKIKLDEEMKNFTERFSNLASDKQESDKCCIDIFYCEDCSTGSDV
ncbi:uncharacterized protein LOC141915401 [Tubulanus polymorphus]|uniref:uncharacterized protein LOC141915401 n=1 Tax=Tubulanus polymorphus TaxID=672921 RepID=UPI003DA1F7D2